MRRAVLLCLAWVGLPGFAHADIYKCTDSYAVSYQSVPCPPGQAQTVISTAKRPEQLAQTAPTAAAAALPVMSRASGRLPAFWRTALALGVSDDEVLNMPGWGVPSRIERSRDGRVYKEAWMYERPSGGTRWLYFANAKLIGVDVETPPAERVAGFALR